MMKIALGSDHGGYQLKENIKEYLKELNVTGIGMSVIANKVRGIRAALCYNEFTARCAREHNNANILVLGGRVIGSGLAKEIVKVWLNTNFSREERHTNRLNKIKQEEDKIYK
jgi:ribose 5-phosphate isomerase B